MTKYEYQCGDNVFWKLKNGILSITGTGDMWNWTWNYKDSGNCDVPWKNSRSSITEVFISSGVTSIGDLAFIYCHNLKSVRLSSSITYIGPSAFSRCNNLIRIDNIPEKWVDARNDLDICCSCGMKTSISPGPSWDGQNILDGEIRKVGIKSRTPDRMAYHIPWGFDKPEIGEIIQFKVEYPFYCKMGGCFSIMINMNEFVTARLIKYWRANVRARRD